MPSLQYRASGDWNSACALRLPPFGCDRCVKGERGRQHLSGLTRPPPTRKLEDVPNVYWRHRPPLLSSRPHRIYIFRLRRFEITRCHPISNTAHPEDDANDVWPLMVTSFIKHNRLHRLPVNHPLLFPSLVRQSGQTPRKTVNSTNAGSDIGHIVSSNRGAQLSTRGLCAIEELSL